MAYSVADFAAACRPRDQNDTMRISQQPVKFLYILGREPEPVLGDKEVFFIEQTHHDFFAATWALKTYGR